MSNNMKKKWTKLGNIITSLALFQRQEVRNVADPDAISEEIKNFNIKQMKMAALKGSDVFMKLDFAGDAFDLVRRIQMFCECAAVGSPDHIQQMVKIIEKDPKKFLLEPNDPMHLLNRKNNQGWTPLYIAAKHGNLEAVKLLIENKADYKLKCKISPNVNTEELPLQASVKWGHSNVVSYLLKNGEYEPKLLKHCMEIAPNAMVKAALQNHSQGGTRRQSTLSLLCNCLTK